MIVKIVAIIVIVGVGVIVNHYALDYEEKIGRYEGK